MRPHYDSPRQAIMKMESFSDDELSALAERSVALARQYLPRVTSASSADMFPIWGEDWFGIEWVHDSIWFQEAGIRPFTMRNLAGKTIPMWVYDDNGELRRKNPKAETRVRDDNKRTQVLIFRRAAKMGERREVLRRQGGQDVMVSVPRSYPGAPGRIAVNRSRGILRAGDIDPGARNRGAIAQRNVGVRWRHPGLDAGKHVARGLADAVDEAGYEVQDVIYLPAGAAFTGAPYDLVIVRG